MNKVFVVLVVVLGFAMTSQGFEGPNHEGPCGKFKLDADQKSKMKAAWFKFREEKIDIKAQIEKSRLKYSKLISDSSTDYATAKAASKDVSDNVAKMISAKESFKTQIAFEVLKPEQREMAMMCLPYLKGKGHHHGHHQHGDWN